MIGLSVAVIGGFVWIGLRGSGDLQTFLVGAAVSAVAAWTTRAPWRGRPSPIRLVRAALICMQILFRFVADLALANARQLRLVLSPRVRVRPRWVRFTSCLEQPVTREILGVLISLTPGTVTEQMQGKEFVVHVLDADPEEDPAAAIRDRFEAPLARLEAL